MERIIILAHHETARFYILLILAILPLAKAPLQVAPHSVSGKIQPFVVIQAHTCHAAIRIVAPTRFLALTRPSPCSQATFVIAGLDGTITLNLAQYPPKFITLEL